MARSFLYRFLNLVDGTWRNAVYLECGVCPFDLQCSSDYLLTVDYDGTPLLYSVCQFQKETGESVDKAECISVMSRSVFEQLYQQQGVHLGPTGDDALVHFKLEDPHRGGSIGFVHRKGTGGWLSISQKQR